MLETAAGEGGGVPHTIQTMLMLPSPHRPEASTSHVLPEAPILPRLIPPAFQPCPLLKELTIHHLSISQDAFGHK